MSKLLPFLACLFLLFASGCKKNQTGVSYTISGLHDITVRQYVDTVVEIDYSALIQSDLTEMFIAEAEDLPSGVTATSDSSLSIMGKGTNTCTGKLRLYCHATTAGTYACTLNTRTLSSPQRKTAFKITVLPNAPYVFSLSTSDITIPKYFGGILQVPISANYVSGNKNEWVTITPVTLPTLTVSPATVKAIPDFTGQFEVHVFGTEVGTTFPITVDASSSQNAVSISFNIHVTSPPQDCAPLLSGKYAVSGSSDTATVSAAGTNQIEINIGINTIIATIDGNTGQLTTNGTNMNIGGFRITFESGSFTATAIILDYFYKEGGGAPLQGYGSLTLTKII